MRAGLMLVPKLYSLKSLDLWNKLISKHKIKSGSTIPIGDMCKLCLVINLPSLINFSLTFSKGLKIPSCFLAKDLAILDRINFKRLCLGS